MKSFYTSHYFQERDWLDIHLAKTIIFLAREKNLKKILDVGCGTGKLVNYLNQNSFNAQGCDTSEEAVKKARKINQKNRIVKASATHLPFVEHSFDMITAISVIEHLDAKDARKFLQEAYRVVKPGGLIFLVTPNFASPFRFLQGKGWFAYADPTHITFYTPRSLSMLLIKYGFKNPKLWFKTMYNPPYEWEMAGILGKLPKLAKSLLTYLLISTPFGFLRNSFWIMGQKK